MLLSQFPLNFLQSQRDVPIHQIAFNYSRADWDDFFRNGDSAARQFCEEIQVGIDVYYQLYVDLSL